MKTADVRRAPPLERSRTLAIGAALGVVVVANAGNAAAAIDEPTPKAPADAASSLKGSVFIDPLGFVLFGPTAGVELGLGRFSAIAYGRWLNVGILAKALFLSENDKFDFSYGAGLKGRYYLKPNLVGPYLGLAVELLKTRTSSEIDKVAVYNTIVVPELEGGYRWGFGQFFLGASAGIGYAFQASKSVENIDGGNQAQFFEAKDVSTIYGSANLDVGLLF